jgi:glycosyltransferase involved in cell wall biosynthesis
MYGLVSGGIGRYTAELIRGLENLDQQNQYIIFVGKEADQLYQPGAKNFQKVLAPFPWYGLAEQKMYPGLIKKFAPDLMHFPHFNGPYFYRGPYVMTVHDLILLKYPSTRATTLGPLKFRLKYLGFKFNTTHALKKAQKIIAVSENTKKDIIKYFKVKLEKIVVTYEAATKLPAQDGVVDDRILKNKYNITKDFLLYVGNAYPHKNLEGLILAFNQLKKECDRQLVLVGRKNYFYERLEQETRAKSLDKDVIFFGLADDTVLNLLYQKASLYVFPSFYEGFGLPPLEAMQYGLPVVSSNTSCLPEILGEAVLYFNPHNIDEMAAVIKKALLDQELRQKLVQQGYERIKQFSWQKMARETLAIYNSCV